MKIRDELMKSLDLSDIVKLRRDLKCREGLLIDFDYGASLFVPENTKVGAVEQGLDEKGGGDKDDETVLDQPLQSNEAEAQHPTSMLPRAPSGSRTVCFS